MSKKSSLAPQWELQQDFNGITENAVFPEYLDEGNYKPRTLIDETLETIDPTPNIHTMFVQFNEKFFYNKLLPVQVKWSQRMTTCAGTCSFHPHNRECIIALSAPLLKLRPRKDLVETLLHEMIHGYLFLTNNNRDRDGHGPEFCKHMIRINRDAGTNITIYHNFHNEVRLYQQHWWRCNGPCQKRAPYFGTVRRAINRTPGPSDYWFASHKMNCGGEFVKIREPTSKSKSKNRNKQTVKLPELKNTMDRYIISVNSKNSSPIIITKPPSSLNDSPEQNDSIKKINGQVESNTSPSSNSNFKGYPCNGKGKISPRVFTKLGTGTNNVYGFVAIGYDSPLKKSQFNDTTVRSKSSRKVNFSGVVGGETTGRSNLLDKFHSSPPQQVSKKPKMIDSSAVQCPICNIEFSHELINSHIDMCLTQENNDKYPPVKRPKIFSSNGNNYKINVDSIRENDDHCVCPICHKKFSNDIINIHLDGCLVTQNVTNVTPSRTNEESDEICINDPSVSTVFHECPICNHFYIESEIFDHVNRCLIDAEEKNKNDERKNKNEEIIGRSTASANDGTDRDHIMCPTCSHNIAVADYIVHVETCLAVNHINSNISKNSIIILDDDSHNLECSQQKDNSSDTYRCLVCDAVISKSIPLNEHLEYCVSITYRDETIAKITDVNELPLINVNDDYDDKTKMEEEEEEGERHLCPICMRMIEECLMAQHVDECIKTIH